MNIVLIADGHPREWPILKALSQYDPSIVWIQPTYESLARAKNKSAIKLLGDKLMNLYYGLRRRAYYRLVKMKAGRPDFAFTQHIRLNWMELETDEGIQLITNLQPDIIITCRAPILQDRLLETAGLCGINVHFGIVPDYRGNEGLYWAVMNNDFDALGGSIHLLDPGIDTGGKLVDAFPKLEKNASIIDIELAVSHVLSEALVACLNKIAKTNSTPEAAPQQRAGHNYLSKERTFAKDVQYLLKRSTTTIPAQEKFIRFFF